jgi:hypothetical protein
MGTPGAGMIEPSASRIRNVVTRRDAMIRDAYAALGRGDLAPWMELLDRAVVWRAVDEAAVQQAPS